MYSVPVRITVRCIVSALVGGGVALLADALIDSAPHDIASQPHRPKPERSISYQPRGGAANSPDWCLREDRLARAATDAEFKDVLSMEEFLEAFLRTPRDARLLGFALGYGYGTRHSASDLRSFHGEVMDRETFLHLLLPGILGAGERQPDPLLLFRLIQSEWKDDLLVNKELSAELVAVCIRLSAESGKLDPDGTVDILELPPHGTSDGQPATATAISAIETAAVLSPLTFDALMRRLVERHPGITVEAIASADLPPDEFAASIDTLSKPARDELARRLSARVINGTPAEIEKIIARFPNPADIPSDAAGRFLFALALLGPERLELWFGQMDPGQRNAVYGNFTQVLAQFRNFPVRQRMHMVKFRAGQILRTPCIRADITNPHVVNLLSDCDDRTLLRDIYQQLRDNPDPESREARKTALFHLFNQVIEDDGAASLEDIIQRSSPGHTEEEQAMAERVLVMKDFARAERLRHETSDPLLALRLDEQLCSDTGFLYSKTHAERFDLLARRLDSQQGELTPGTAQAVRTFLLFSGAERPMISALIAKLPEDQFREKVMRELVSQEAEFDPMWIPDWLSTLPLSRSRDIAIGELIKSSHDDPERSLANAAVIQDSALRVRAAASLVMRWNHVNREGMREWIRSSPLPSADKETLIRMNTGSPQ
jgi:hypothetical protein